jgi:glycosyltransferase involved in cell wall biosynthesis
MRVSLVDPSAFTPPYDRSLAAALAGAGVEVELITSRFAYGSVPLPRGYSVRQPFYRFSARAGRDSHLRLLLKALEHPAQMLAAGRRAGRDSDLVHWQWVTYPPLDRFLVGSSGHPRVLTLHYPLPRPGDTVGLRRQRSFLRRFDAVIAHTAGGAERLREEIGLEPERVHTIPHGPLDYLVERPDSSAASAAGPGAPSRLPPELAEVDQGEPVILFFGLLRPYKGVDTLLEAFAQLEGAELWIAGMPRMPIEPLRELASKAPGTVRLLPRFISDEEIPALLRRAELLALPYRELEQSGVLYAGLAFGKPMVLGDVGGFSEIGRDRGAARLVPPDDPDALARALRELLADPAARERLSRAALAAVEGPFSWAGIATRTIELYESLLGGG